MPEIDDDGRPAQLRSLYQDLVEMAESEIDEQRTGDLRFAVTKANLTEQNTGGLRLPVSTSEIVLAIAADSSIMKDMTVPVDVLEFFAGAAGISKAMKQQGFVVGPPIDIATGYDLNAESGQAKAWELMADLEPNFTFLAPVCTAWSALSNATPYDLRMRKREAVMPMVDFTIGIATYQHEMGRYFMIEIQRLAKCGL